MKTMYTIISDPNFNALATSLIFGCLIVLAFVHLTRPRHGYKHYHYLEG